MSQKYFCLECNDSLYHEFVRDNPLLFTGAELAAIYRIIEKEWINRDDPEAMAVADRISRFVRERA